MKIKDAIIRVVDCETTGLNPKEDRVIEVARVDMNYESGIVDSSSSLIDPERDIPIGSMVVHHITNKMVEGAPKLEEVWPGFREGNFHAMAAHNAEFDFAFLKTDAPYLCTMRLAQHLWPGLESYKNQYLRYYLGIEEVGADVPMHRAMGDTTVTALILHRMLKIVVEEKGIGDLERLIEWANEPVLLDKCWFGKHYGQKWSEVPKDYLRWMKTNNVRMDDANMAHTVEHYLNI
ncbi:DNA polymerase III subunit epsilon [Candidatus Micrarchaeota archaeon]|nr:DNA polymerase III subunit epsilon [Candidatus Micrarchaeota archaeon]